MFGACGPWLALVASATLCAARMSEAAETLLQERQGERQDNVFGDEEVVLRKSSGKLRTLLSRKAAFNTPLTLLWHGLSL